MNLCINCAHARHVAAGVDCYHPNNLYISPVDGKQKDRLDCLVLRRHDEEKYCGPSGRWFKDNGAFGEGPK